MVGVGRIRDLRSEIGNKNKKNRKLRWLENGARKLSKLVKNERNGNLKGKDENVEKISQKLKNVFKIL